ncbi:HD domain-containing protein [Heliorestis convoluta]|uniref:HDIG domain-containing protein n=1 Tax=Heliorestis convoluta TaxID=356322 RepID=A0A5Q2N2T9_9FIRM|nr:HD domain-containing protein [Heliorestis convoluta]QGG46895.1 HDIG domain-containing protein [Heliorestis convoluta]
MKKIFSKVIYRCRQVLWALNSKVTPEEETWTASLLTKEEYTIFSQLNLSDQRHCLDVAYYCKEKAKHLEEKQQKLLVKVSLLHDMGKRHHRLQLWHRILYVLLQNHPNWLNKAKKTSLLQKPLEVLACHSSIGAEEAKKRGWSNDVITLIHHHHNPHATLEQPLAELLTLLQEADEKY